MSRFVVRSDVFAGMIRDLSALSLCPAAHLRVLVLVKRKVAHQHLACMLLLPLAVLLGRCPAAWCTHDSADEAAYLGCADGGGAVHGCADERRVLRAHLLPLLRRRLL